MAKVKGIRPHTSVVINQVTTAIQVPDEWDNRRTWDMGTVYMPT